MNLYFSDNYLLIHGIREVVSCLAHVEACAASKSSRSAVQASAAGEWGCTLYRSDWHELMAANVASAHLVSSGVDRLLTLSRLSTSAGKTESLNETIVSHKQQGLTTRIVAQYTRLVNFLLTDVAKSWVL
jgi:hypothetical protein